jgi:hypothetical protein
VPSMPMGIELDKLNARIRAAYPKTCAILEQALCEKCAHRGQYRGCRYNFVPIQERGLHSCRYFRQWGNWQVNHVVKSSN